MPELERVPLIGRAIGLHRREGRHGGAPLRGRTDPVRPWLAGFLLLAAPATLHAGSVDWLPETPLLTPQVADPRETATAFTLRSGTTRLDGTIADRVCLLHYTTSDLALQVDLGLGLFLGFDPGGSLTFGITTVDGLIRLPVAARWRDLGALVEWAHLSAHYADGVRQSDLRPPEDEGPWSREYVRVAFSWEHATFRPYVGSRALIHTMPEAPILGFQAGWTVLGPWRVAPFHAADLKLDADRGWRPALSGQAGVAFRAGGASALVLAATGHWGPDDTGKLQGEDDPYLGGMIGFYRLPPGTTPPPPAGP